MSQCVVVGCAAEATVTAGKPTEWGAWEYRVCADHKRQVDDGAEIDDQADGRSIVVRPVIEVPGAAPSVSP